MAGAAAAQILLICREKTEFELYFLTPVYGTFVQNSIFYKKIPSENFPISTYSPKNKFKRFFPTPSSDTIVQNQFLTINILEKFLIQLYRF